MAQNDTPKNFVSFKPQKSDLLLNVKLKKDEEIDEIIDNSDLCQLSYNNRYKQYCFKLKQKDLVDNKEVIVNLFKRAYESKTGDTLEDGKLN